MKPFCLLLFIVAFSDILFSQKLKINSCYAIHSPRIRVDSTSLDEVIAHYGKDYKEIKILANQYCIEYANGLSFEYHPSDEKKLVRAFLIREPMKAVDINGIEIGKSRVKDVLDLPLAYAKTGNIRAMVHTPFMNYTFKPDWKFKDGLDSNALITGFYRYYGSYVYFPHYSAYDNLPCKKVEELAKVFLPACDSVMSRIYGKALFKNYFKLAEKDFFAITEEGEIMDYDECVPKTHVEKYEIAYYFAFPGAKSDYRHYWQLVLNHQGKILEGGKKFWVFKDDHLKTQPLCQKIDVEKVKATVQKKFDKPFSDCAVIPYEDDYISKDGDYLKIDTSHFFLEITYYHWIKEAKDIGDKYKYTTKNMIMDACTCEVMKFWEETKQGTRNRPGHF